MVKHRPSLAAFEPKVRKKSFGVDGIVRPNILNSFEDANDGQLFHKRSSFNNESLQRQTNIRESRDIVALKKPKQMMRILPRRCMKHVISKVIQVLLPSRASAQENRHGIKFLDHVSKAVLDVHRDIIDVAVATMGRGTELRHIATIGGDLAPVDKSLRIPLLS